MGKDLTIILDVPAHRRSFRQLLPDNRPAVCGMLFGNLLLSRCVYSVETLRVWQFRPEACAAMTASSSWSGCCRKGTEERTEMKKLTSLVTSVCLVSCLVGCNPPAAKDTSTTPQPDANASLGEAPEGAGSTTEAAPATEPAPAPAESTPEKPAAPTEAAPEKTETPAPESSSN